MSKVKKIGENKVFYYQYDSPQHSNNFKHKYVDFQLSCLSPIIASTLGGGFILMPNTFAIRNKTVYRALSLETFLSEKHVTYIYSNNKRQMLVKQNDSNDYVILMQSFIHGDS